MTAYYAQLILSLSVGMMFMFSGYKKCTHSYIREKMVHMFEMDGIPFPKFMQWWVPCWEFNGGLMIIIGSLFSIWWMDTFGALVLGLICLVALVSEQIPDMVKKKNPQSLCEWGSCLLYLVEVQLGAALIAIILL